MPYDPEGERQLKCLDILCCNNITDQLPYIWDQEIVERQNALATQRHAELEEKFHPYPMPDPTQPF